MREGGPSREGSWTQTAERARSPDREEDAPGLMQVWSTAFFVVRGSAHSPYREEGRSAPDSLSACRKLL